MSSMSGSAGHFTSNCLSIGRSRSRSCWCTNDISSNRHSQSSGTSRDFGSYASKWNTSVSGRGMNYLFGKG